MTAPLPPSPPGAPLVGHALAFRRDPLALLARAAALGDVTRLRLGVEPLVLVTRPALVEEVLVARAAAFRKSRLVRVLGRLVLGDALDALDGEAWQARVRAVAPAFKKARFEAHAPAMAREAARLCDGLGEGEVRALDDDLLDLALRIQGRVLLGVDLAVEAPSLRAAIRRALAGWSARVRLGLPTTDWLPAPHNLAMRRAMARLRSTVARAIGARRAGDDVLSALLEARALDDRALVDELTVMAFLGAHQVALALAWTVRLLGEHADAQARAADPAFAALVVEEALRLYPPFFLLVREAKDDLELGGFRVPRGCAVGVSPWLVQRDPRWFDAPDAFRPERWADGLARRLPRFAHFPFGGGARGCLANALVRLELQQVVSTLCARASFALVGPAPAPRPDVALALASPLFVEARRRRAVEVAA